MMGLDAKASLHDYLQGAREVLLWNVHDISLRHQSGPPCPMACAPIERRGSAGGVTV